MARTNESAVQRLQVGLVGLLVVLICVSIASMILSQADSKQAASEAIVGGLPQREASKAPAEDPMVELGVTPVVPEQPEKQVPQKRQPN
jgi:hypothetical protein